MADNFNALTDAQFRELLNIFTRVIDDGLYFLDVGGDKMRGFMDEVAKKKRKGPYTDQEWSALAKAANEKCRLWWAHEAPDAEKKAQVFKYSPNQRVTKRHCVRALVVVECHRFKGGGGARSLNETFRKPGAVPGDRAEPAFPPSASSTAPAPARAQLAAPTPAPWAPASAKQPCAAPVEGGVPPGAAAPGGPPQQPPGSPEPEGEPWPSRVGDLRQAPAAALAQVGEAASAASAPAKELPPPVAPQTPPAPAQENMDASPGAASSGWQGAVAPEAQPPPPPSRGPVTPPPPPPEPAPKMDAEEPSELEALRLENKRLVLEVQRLQRNDRRLRQRLGAAALSFQKLSQTLLDEDSDAEVASRARPDLRDTGSDAELESEEAVLQGGDSDNASERGDTGSTTSSMLAKAKRLGKQTEAEVIEFLKQERRSRPGSTTSSILLQANWVGGRTRDEVTERLKLAARSGHKFSQTSQMRQHLAEHEQERLPRYDPIERSRKVTFHNPFDSVDALRARLPLPAQDDAEALVWPECTAIQELLTRPREYQDRLAPLVVHLKLSNRVSYGVFKGRLSNHDLPDAADIQLYNTVPPCANVAFRTPEDARRAKDVLPQLQEQLGVTGLSPWCPRGSTRSARHTLWFKNYCLVPLTEQQLEDVAKRFSSGARVTVEVTGYWQRHRVNYETDVVFTGCIVFEEESHADALVSALVDALDQQQWMKVLKRQPGIDAPIAFMRDRGYVDRDS